MDTRFIHSFSNTLFIFTYNLNLIWNISFKLFSMYTMGWDGDLWRNCWTFGPDALYTGGTNHFWGRESRILQIYNNLHCFEPTYNINRAIYKELTEKWWSGGHEMVKTGTSDGNEELLVSSTWSVKTFSYHALSLDEDKFLQAVLAYLQVCKHPAKIFLSVNIWFPCTLISVWKEPTAWV